MLETLKRSPEPRHLVEAAVKYLRGVKGHLVQKKKREREIREGREVPGISGGMGAGELAAVLQFNRNGEVGPAGAARDLDRRG